MIGIRFIFRSQAAMQVMGSALMYLSYFIVYLSDVLVQWELAGMIGKKGLKISVVITPLNAFLAASHIDVYFKKNKDKLKGTFNGTANGV